MIARIYGFIVANDTLVSLGISAFDVIITTVLTAIIIIQTSRINKKQQKAEEQSSKQQQEFEEKINQQQIELQKRQIQVDTFPYKREIYAHVFSVLELCHMLKELTKSVDLKCKTAVQLKEFFDILLEQYVPDKKQALWSMREAEYILPENISTAVIDIRAHFDSMCSHFYLPNTVSKVLTPYELETEAEEIKHSNIDEAIKDCDAIIAHTQFIETILPQELNIANLNK